MTMPPPAHPDPERLAALAGDDAEARADSALVGHVAACSACSRQVGEMGRLRASMAELPDLAPSRPLQYVPRVPATAPSGWRVAVRRAFAPVAAAGMVLVFVGGVGATGVLGPADARQLFSLPFQQAASAPDPAQPEVSDPDSDEGGTTDGAGQPTTASAPPAENGGAGLLGETPEPPREVGGQDVEEEPTSRDLDAESTPTSGWVLVLAVGIGLLIVSVLFRTASPNRVSPRR